MTKIIGSIMTIFFSFIMFAYGQSCQLLPGWNPSTLADGQSRTWYQIQEATFTQSCTQAAWTITCISWSVANGNVFVYPSCTPHTWANCTTPTGANHLQYRTLYKANYNTYTQSCQQLSQSLQCLNGIFTGWITPQFYTFATCTDQARAQCIDVRTNPDSYKDHGETVIGYTASTPGLGQTCSTLQRTLTCTNSFWSGNGNAGQQWLVTSCTNPSSFVWCTNVWTNTIIPHGSTLTAYTSPNGICANILKPLTCVNGIWSGNGTAQQAGLSSSCVEANTASCPEVIVGLGTGSRPHGSFITEYTDAIAFQPNDYCIDFAKQLQCINGTRSWYQPGLHTWCQNVAAGSCFNNLSNQYVPSLQFVSVYTSQTPITPLGCEGVKVPVYCNSGIRHQQNASWPTLGSTLPSSFHANCGGCMTPRLTLVNSWRSDYGFSLTWTMLPKTCSQFTTLLSCNGNILNGNRQTYKYPSCSWEQLLQWIDLTINESPGLPGQENLITGIIAQWSSPQINILFKNKWNTSLNQTFPAPWFLSCVRKEQGLSVYASNPIVDSFIVNAGSKIGINIRIKSLFTQSLWVKTLVCSFNSSTIVGELNPWNNVWSWTFEIVEASRFDLALSKSIESISKNLESAEWAKWTQGLQNFLYNKIMNVLVPLIIIIGILSAILWFYKLMFSSDEKAVDEWTRYIIYGVIWIIIIMSARFIGQNVFEMLNTGTIVWGDIAQWLYNRIVYPFIKFAIYLVLGAMFVILVTRVITFLFGTDADAVKKAGTLIWWNVISMLIIIWAKQIVQAIYGKQADVINQNATNLGEIGSGILADKNIPILYQVINYALGIASLVILVVIIIQTVKLLMKPDDAAQIKSIKNSLVYMLLGIFVLGAGYLIVNFAIIN